MQRLASLMIVLFVAGGLCAESSAGNKRSARGFVNAARLHKKGNAGNRTLKLRSKKERGNLFGAPAFGQQTPQTLPATPPAKTTTPPEKRKVKRPARKDDGRKRRDRAAAAQVEATATPATVDTAQATGDTAQAPPVSRAKRAVRGLLSLVGFRMR
jgi:hypothetical protein